MPRPGCIRRRTTGARGRNPAVLRRAILVEARVWAQTVAGRELKSRVAPVLPSFVRGVAHPCEEILITIVGLRETAEAGEIAVAENHDIDARHRGNLIGVVDAFNGLDHHDAEHVVVDRVPVGFARVQEFVPELAAALTAPANRRKPRPAGRVSRFEHVVYGRHDGAQNAQVVRLLHVGFQRIGHADHRRGANARARMHHLLDLVESETRVLHLEPREIVMRRHLAILLGVERALRMAEHLLARQELGLGSVVELSIRILHERPGCPAPWPAGIQRYRSQGAIGVLRRRAAALRARPRHCPHQRQHESADNSCSEHVPLLFEFWKREYATNRFLFPVPVPRSRWATNSGGRRS